MNYRTRELVALREFHHIDRSLAVGDTLYATPVDAEYYLTRGMARDAAAAPTAAGEQPSKPQALEQQESAAAPTTPQRRRRTIAAAPAASDDSSGAGESGTDHGAD